MRSIFFIVISWAMLSAFTDLHGQTTINLRTQGRDIDFSGAASTIPFQSGTVLPATCSTGQAFFKTDAIPGKNLYACTSSNLWSLMGTVLDIPPVSGQTGKVLSTDGSVAAWSALGGDVTGLPGSIAIAGLQGRVLNSAQPANNDVIKWDSAAAQWRPQPEAADYTSGAGIVIANSTITTDDSVIPYYYTGTGAPSQNCQAGRDYYVDTVGQALYFCAATNQWQSTVSSAGSQTLPADVVKTDQSNTYTAGTQDFSQAASTLPAQMGSALPSTCRSGQLFFLPTGALRRQLYLCTTSSTWVEVAYGQGASSPATCQTGEVFFRTDAAAGKNLYFCTATNTWTQMDSSLSYQTVQLNGTGQTQRAALNLKAGTNVTITASDNSGSGSTDVTINSSGGGGSVTAGTRIYTSGGGSTMNHTYVDGSHPGFVEDFLSWSSATIPGSAVRFGKMTTGTSTLTLADLQKSAYSAYPERNPGVIKLTTTSTSGDGGALFLATNGSNGFVESVGKFSQDFVFKTVVCLTSTATEGIYSGLGINPSSFFSGGSDGILLRYDTFLSDTTWRLIVNNASANVANVDTLVAPATGCHELNITSIGGTISGWVDGNSAVATTSLPNSTQIMVPFLGFVTRASAAAYLEWDMVAFENRSIATRY